MKKIQNRRMRQYRNRTNGGTLLLFKKITSALLPVLLFSMSVTVLAYFTDRISVSVNPVSSASYSVTVYEEISGERVEDIYVCPSATDGVHSFTLAASGTSSSGYAVITIEDRQYYTELLPAEESMTLYIRADEHTTIAFSSCWGDPMNNSGSEPDCLYGSGDTIVFSENEPGNPFEGKTISVLGDSISTYIGWSDKYPITSEDCTYRYGEPYYGPVGSDCHNTDLLVEDTWWHQAAQELGAEILISNAGNSTGLLYASYPANAGWQQYLQEMLAYKSRPDYLGTEERDPDIIALYIGSNDVAKADIDQFGSVSEIDFDTLIVQNEDGSYTYAEPQTVAEAYSIMLHKIKRNYPEAEIYCFTVVPNAGGYLSTCNTRLVRVTPFNVMVKEVAAYHGAIVVDLMEAFQLDPDGDGVAVQEDFDIFHSYYHNDPHPNAAGFDVITSCFVSTVRENSKYNK